jgi:AcrR family transcriptional regulator
MTVRDTEDGTFSDVKPDAARRLVLAAVEAFAERGYHATTTRDIAGRAGMSPAALYIHYKTKEELLYQISGVGHRLALRVLEEAAGAGGAPAERLAAGVRAFARWHAEHHTVARVIQYELGALAPGHRAEIVDLRHRSDQVVREVIQEGAAAGDFAVPDLNGTTLAVMSLCVDVARWFGAEHRRRSPAAIGALYADLVLRLVRPPR